MKSLFSCRYLDGASKQGEEVPANWQQDEHTVEVEAGGRSSGPGQSVLTGERTSGERLNLLHKNK